MLKQISTLFVLSSLTANVYATVCGQDAATKCALQLSQETFADMNCTDIPQVVDFTLTNNTSGPITIDSDIFDGSVNGATVTITGGNCGNSAPPGECSIEVTVTPDCDGITPGDSIEVDAILIVDPDANQGNLDAAIQLTITNPISSYVAVAGGEAQPEPPLEQNADALSNPFYVVHNANNAWTSTIETFFGVINSAACGGVGASATCFVGGKNNQLASLILYRSINGGVSWNSATNFSPSVTNGNINSITCTDDAALCALTIEDSAGPSLYKTTNNGNVWTGVNTFTATSDTNIIDCDGLACAVPGVDTSTTYPIFYFSFDGFANNSNLTTGTTGAMQAASCASVDLSTNPKQQICFFAGRSGASDPALFAIKEASLPTLTNVTPISLPAGSTTIDAIDCAVAGGAVTCLAAGANTSGITVYTNPDAYGNPSMWTASTATYLKSVSSISCATKSNSVGCVIAGKSSTDTAAVLVFTTLFNNTFSTSVQGNFESVTCKPTTLADDVFCIAVGTSAASAPLLYVNEGIFAAPAAGWSVAPVALPSTGALHSTGAAK